MPRISRLDRSQVSPEVGEIYELSAIGLFNYFIRFTLYGWNRPSRLDTVSSRKGKAPGPSQ